MNDIAPLPLKDDLIEFDPRDPFFRGRRMLISSSYASWLQNSLQPRVQAAGQVLTVVRLTDQDASIPVTPVPLLNLASGLYRVSWYFRVTTAGGATGSLQVTVNWLESAIALGYSGAVEAGNTTHTTQSGAITIESDGNSPISYSTTYASTGVPDMKYRLTIGIELLQ